VDCLSIHFLNVGHGDCTIIDFPSGHLTMIDVNNSRSLPDEDEIALAQDRGLSVEAFRGVGVTFAKGQQSWEDYYRSLLVDPAEYLKDNFPGRTIFRYIQTHPDMDHMSGLCRIFWQDDVSLANFWYVPNDRSRSKEDFVGSRFDWNDWIVYQRMKKGIVQDDDEHVVITAERGENRNYWNGDGVSILAPTSDLITEANASENWNNLSYVLRIGFGGRSAILGGDAEKKVWDSIELGWPEALPCDILKAAHHGRKSGFSDTAWAQMDPSIVICSVGKKPETDAYDGYKSVASDVLSTRFCGTITVTIWADGEVWANNSKGDRVAELPPL
jgi:competence protein ComEC